MDRNNLIGFGLLLLLLVGYVVWNNKSQADYLAQKRADSIAAVKARPQALPDTPSLAQQITPADTILDSSIASAFKGVVSEQVLENNKLSITFSSKGAHPVAAEVKGFKTYDKKPLYLFKGKGNELSIQLPENNGALSTADLHFSPNLQGNTLEYTADLGDGKKAIITYSLPENEYMLQTKVQLIGMAINALPMTWKVEGLHTEKDIAHERVSTQVYYKQKDGDDDYYTIQENDQQTISEPLSWLGYRQLYFSSALVADNDGFASTDLNTTITTGTDAIVAKNKFLFHLPVEPGFQQAFSFKWFIGPNDYQLLKNYNLGLEEMVPLGYGVFAFVKYINKFIIGPIFYSLADWIGNYGVVIMLLTIIIRLLLSFFTYKSYLSSAKMRVLKPEMDELRAKYGDDQQRFGMEQMKLYRSAGVNPLGGCLPSLLQLPILVALYYFIPTAIELRGQPFLWADDLSTYDSIYNFPNGFSIPFYGSHVSLFTLLMTASSLFLALYNRNMNADPNNPMLKYMPYIFPFMLIGIFNKMAAALTFYYFFSNVISIIQQWVIQKFIINEDKIHAKIQENKNKPATPSKWQQRMEEMQRMQQERTKTKQQPIRKK